LIPEKDPSRNLETLLSKSKPREQEELAAREELLRIADKTIHAAELSLRIPNLSVETDKISSNTVATSEVRAKTWVKDSSKLYTVVLPKKKRKSKILLKEPRCLKSKKPPMKQYFDDQGINASTVSNSLTKLKNSPFRKLT
jgi:hypothetical protein